MNINRHQAEDTDTTEQKLKQAHTAVTVLFTATALLCGMLIVGFGVFFIERCVA